MKIRFGTRSSKLALVQTEKVIEMITACRSDIETQIVKIRTLGDSITNLPLFKVGGQGLFVKEIERALLQNEIDLAVHSLKDLPHSSPDELAVGAVGLPCSPCDVLISRNGTTLQAMPTGSLIGTSSLRRRAQLIRIRSDLRFADLRGNLDTRLKKLDAGEVDAIVLAAAGLQRLGLDTRISEVFPVETLIPAACQGLIGVQCRECDLDKLKDILKCINDQKAEARSIAERSFLKTVQGGCQTPMGVHAQITGSEMIVTAFISDSEGVSYKSCTEKDRVEKACELGARVAANILSRS